MVAGGWARRDGRVRVFFAFSMLGVRVTNYPIRTLAGTIVVETCRRGHPAEPQRSRSSSQVKALRASFPSAIAGPIPLGARASPMMTKGASS